MEKVYDRVEWTFLKQVLMRFSFSSKWIGIAENCWASSWVSMLVNREASGFFKPSRGLRQGDPLSPSIFIICADVLSRGLNRHVDQGHCLPYKLKRSCPRVTHLLYADDTLLFLNGSIKSLRKTMTVLDDYQKASGVPLAVGRLKARDFQPLIDKVEGRIRGSMLKELEGRFSSFFWGWADGKRKLHWRSWETITRPKVEGGLRIQKLSEVMHAFQIKMAWTSKFQKDSNFSAVFMAAKYGMMQ
ncbi:uncharacterized protein LOC131220184 [Magnolia sinica]|uniref:uncharacterized protein LOC131220184 n=1 Tax=Magnolia sinica TaxID=86752 RepID=UPI002659B156|nr:uncharacterized protein LOC131220184 [Magnolia sinica]